VTILNFPLLRRKSFCFRSLRRCHIS